MGAPDGIEVPRVDVAIAKYVAMYGMDAFCSAAFPTPDHVVPMALFDLLYGAMGAVEDAEQLRSANAAAHGEAMVRAGKDADVKAYTREMERRANPLRWIPLAPKGQARKA